MFVPHHTIVTAEGRTPEQLMLVLHGIYGSGANWRSFASKLCERDPAWGFALVDLRMHGRSQAAPAPHTVTAAAGDLVALCDQLKLQSAPVRAVCGHSFGGKVALAFRAAVAADASAEPLQQTWVLDAPIRPTPDALAADNAVTKVLRMLATLPARFDSRRAFVEHARAQGLPGAIGQWLAMNLEEVDDDDGGGGGLRSRLDAGAMRLLLEDFHGFDAWPALREGPGEVHVVVAGRSPAVGEDDRAELEALAASSPQVHVHHLAEAGHWLHVDAAQALLDLVAAAM